MRPGMLDSPDVRRWLDGVEPAWTLLDDDSFTALRHASPSPAGAIRLATDLAPDDAERSAVARNTRVLLDAAANGPGLKLTATGNLARSVVADTVEAFTWPGFDKAYEFRFHKVVNEPDYLPLFFIRHIAEGAKRLRKYKGFLTLTQSGRRVLDPANAGALQAVLFHTTIWQLSLSYLARGLHGAWPQYDVGLVLWCLSIAAGLCCMDRFRGGWGRMMLGVLPSVSWGAPCRSKPTPIVATTSRSSVTGLRIRQPTTRLCGSLAA